MSSHSTIETIQQFQNIFAELGIPRHIHCDRGSNYTRMDFQKIMLESFQKFMEGLNVKLTFSSSDATAQIMQKGQCRLSRGS